MKRIQKGNDITVKWYVTKNEGTDLSNARVLLIDTFKRAVPVEVTSEDYQYEVCYTIKYFGKDQTTLGKYNLVMVDNCCQKEMVTLNYLGAFILCKEMHNCISSGEDDDPTVVITSDLTDHYFGDYYTKEEVDALLASKYGDTTHVTFDEEGKVEEDFTDLKKNVFVDGLGNMNLVSEDEESKTYTAVVSTYSEEDDKYEVLTAKLTVNSDGTSTLEYIETVPDLPSFKTINGESIIGEGNIEIKGGEGTAKPEFVLTMNDDYSAIVEDEQLSKLFDYHKQGGTHTGCNILIKSYHRELIPDLVYFGGNEVRITTSTGDEIISVDVAYDANGIIMNTVAIAQLTDKIQTYLDDMEYINSIKTINGQNLVGTGNIEIKGGEGGGLTPEEREALDPMFNTNEGVLRTKELKSYEIVYDEFNSFGYVHPTYLNEYNNDVFFWDSLELYKFNKKTLSFEHITRMNEANQQGVWYDNSGRYYCGNSIQYNSDGTVDHYELNGEYVHSNCKCNIIKGQNGIYKIFWRNVYKFNEETRDFDLFCELGEDLYYYWFTCTILYKGEYVYIYEDKKYVIKEYEDRLDFEAYTPDFDTTLPNGSEITSGSRLYTCGDNIHYMDYSNKYKWTGDHWEEFSVTNDGDVYDLNVYESYRLGMSDLGLWFALDNANSLLSLNENDLKSTFWTKISDIAVDLNSDQEVKGTKRFNSVVSETIGANRIEMTGKGGIVLYNPAKTITGNIGIDLRSQNPITLNGAPIAVKDDTMLNTDVSVGGPFFKKLADVEKSVNHIYCSQSGDIYLHCWESIYKFDGSTLEEVFTGYDFDPNFVYVCEAGIYRYYDGDLQKFNEETYTFDYVAPFNGDLYNTCGYGNNLYCISNGVKFNTTTNQWEEFSFPYQTMYTDTYTIYNGYVYFNYVDYIYRFPVDDDTNVEQYIYSGYYNPRKILFIGDGIYQVSGDGNVYRIFGDQDIRQAFNVFSETGSGGVQAYIYGKDGKIYYANSNVGGFGIVYDVEYSKPEVPADNTDYSLTAHRDGDNTVYEWKKQGGGEGGGTADSLHYESEDKEDGDSTYKDMLDINKEDGVHFYRTDDDDANSLWINREFVQLNSISEDGIYYSTNITPDMLSVGGSDEPELFQMNKFYTGVNGDYDKGTSIHHTDMVEGGYGTHIDINSNGMEISNVVVDKLPDLEAGKVTELHEVGHTIINADGIQYVNSDPTSEDNSVNVLCMSNEQGGIIASKQIPDGEGGNSMEALSGISYGVMMASTVTEEKQNTFIVNTAEWDYTTVMIDNIVQPTIMVLTQDEFDSLTEKKDHILYIIKG